MLAYLKYKLAAKRNTNSPRNLEEVKQDIIDKGIPQPISKRQADPLAASNLEAAQDMGQVDQKLAYSLLKAQSQVSQPSREALEQQPPLARSRTLPSENAAVNYLEDLALTQTMFEKGTLINYGEAEDFVDIIRTNRSSIQNMNQQEVRQYIETHPDLLEPFQEEDKEQELASANRQASKVASSNLLMVQASSEFVPQHSPRQQFPSFSQKLFSKIGKVFLGVNRIEAGDAGATPVVTNTQNVRARLNSDGFLEVTNEAQSEESASAESPSQCVPRPEPSLRLKKPQSEGPTIELPADVQIETDYILTSHLGDWEKLYHEYSFSVDQQSWNLKTEHAVVYKQITEAIQKFSLSNGQSRLLAWSLLMGICNQNVQAVYTDLYRGYLADAFDLEKSTVDDFRVQKQIGLDVKRTFAAQRIGPFIAPVESKTNALFNVLAAFAKHCPEVGYCQGMNFLCGLILIGVDFNEVSAFVILEKLLGEYGQLASLYDGKLTKLFSLSDHVYSWLLEKEPELEELVSNHGVPLTTLFAGPLMAVFSNIFETPETCLNILDRLILQKDHALVSIIKHVFRSMKSELLKYRVVAIRGAQNSDDENDHFQGQSNEISGIRDSGHLQAYLVRLVYLDALQCNLLFPPINV